MSLEHDHLFKIWMHLLPLFHSVRLPRNAMFSGKLKVRQRRLSMLNKRVTFC
jgi:hypothetical protein